MPFDSRECRQFALDWGFKFTFSSPRYPQSNGLAERAVQIAKKMLLKCYEDKTDYRLALLMYRASPVADTNLTPSELLMNRNLRTKRIVPAQYLKPKGYENKLHHFDKSINRNLKNYNKTSRFKNEFYVNQNVWFKKDVNDKLWLPGVIVKSHGFRSYDIVDKKNNVKYTRTSFHIRPA